MLEPLFLCNLSCAGCGKIQYPPNILKRELSVAECIKAVEECDAPVVSIPGGEPLLYSQIGELVAELVKRKKYIYLCTNALLLEEKIHLFEPTPYLNFSVHLDGLEEDHDASVCREGIYQKARYAIELAVERGFRVTTNSTFFNSADADRTRAFFDEMMRLGVEGMTISPGYHYEKAPDQERFLERKRTENLFRKLLHNPKKSWKFNQSPLFLEFLAGNRDFDCTPWGNVTYSIFGWQNPCYLLQDGYAASFRALIEDTEWSHYGPRSGNPKCRNCMLHSGFEASAVDHAFSSLKGLIEISKAAIFGPDIPAPSEDVAEAPGSLPGTEATETPTQGYACDASPEALRQAFDYRGDVTLTFEDGREMEGFVANLKGATLDFWPKGGSRAESVTLEGLIRLTFTGRDAAEGKSWEAWQRSQATGRGVNS
jgi:hopanoid biosynthesis associated radical SAM protein HpnH